MAGQLPQDDNMWFPPAQAQDLEKLIDHLAHGLNEILMEITNAMDETDLLLQVAFNDMTTLMSNGSSDEMEVVQYLLENVTKQFTDVKEHDMTQLKQAMNDVRSTLKVPAGSAVPNIRTDFSAQELQHMIDESRKSDFWKRVACRPDVEVPQLDARTEAGAHLHRRAQSTARTLSKAHDLLLKIKPLLRQKMNVAIHDLNEAAARLAVIHSRACDEGNATIKTLSSISMVVHNIRQAIEDNIRDKFDRAATKLLEILNKVFDEYDHLN